MVYIFYTTIRRKTKAFERSLIFMEMVRFWEIGLATSGVQWNDRFMMEN